MAPGMEAACWNKLTPLLTSAGHRVAHADADGDWATASHLLTPEIDLDTHIEDISALFHYEDVHDAILVGHSYGGMVVAGVAPSVVARLAGVIYLDDVACRTTAKRCADYVTLRPPEGLLAIAAAREASSLWRDATLPTSRGWRHGSPITPLKAMTQPVTIAADISARVPHTFILCTKGPQFVAAAERAKQRGFRYRELLSAGHDAMISQPGELAKLLVE